MNFNSVTQTLRLREYYYMALRHKISFLSVVVFCLGIALSMVFVLPKIYRAETVLLIEDEKILSPLISGLAISPSVAARMRTLREELLSWPRMTLLVEKLKLNEKAKTPLQRERLIKNIRDHILIKMREHDIITISFEGPDPKRAQAIVQTLSDIIISGNITASDLEANSAIRFIKEQLKVYRDNLEESETKLRKFRELYSSTLPVALRMNEQLVSTKIELNNMLVTNTEEHPRVVQTRQLIKQLEGQRDGFMKKAREEGAEINPEEFAKLISSAPLQEQQLARLQRDYAVNESIYQQLLKRLETAKISQTLEESENGTKFRILEPARLPLIPVKPNKTLFLVGGLICGIGLGIFLVYLWELSDNSIRTVEEARNLLGHPIFGSIAPIRPEELLLGERLRQEVGV